MKNQGSFCVPESRSPGYCIGTGTIPANTSLNGSEDGLQVVGFGDITIVICDFGAGVAVEIGAQIEDGNLGLGMALHDEADNVTTQEAATSYDKDFA